MTIKKEVVLKWLKLVSFMIQNNQCMSLCVCNQIIYLDIQQGLNRLIICKNIILSSMEALIKQQFNDFYQKIFSDTIKELLDDNQEIAKTQQNESLMKAKQSIINFKKHIDNYLINSFKPKPSSTNKINDYQDQPINKNSSKIIQTKTIQSQIITNQNKNGETILFKDDKSLQNDKEKKLDHPEQKAKLFSNLTTATTCANQSSLDNINNSSLLSLSGSNISKDNLSNQSKSDTIQIELKPQTSPLFPTNIKGVPKQQIKTNTNVFAPFAHQTSPNTSLFGSPLDLSSNSLFGNNADISYISPKAFTTSSNTLFSKPVQSCSIFQKKPQPSFQAAAFPAVQKPEYKNLALNDEYQESEEQDSENYSYDSNGNDEDIYSNPQQDSVTNLHSFYSKDQSETLQSEQLDQNRFYHYSIGKYAFDNLPEQARSSYLELIQQYYPSNYFHVGPRYAMLDFLTTLGKKIQSQKVNKFQAVDNRLVALGQKIAVYFNPGKITNINQISCQYHSSNYFHVGPRRLMLQTMGDIIKIVAQN